MSDIGIILKPEKVLAFLGGATQMRVPVDPQPEAWMVKGVNRVMNYRKSPFGVPGDVVWFKETFRYGFIKDGDGIRYRADNAVLKYVSKIVYGDAFIFGLRADESVNWHPAGHMARDASRIVRTVKRAWVADSISEEDAKACGCKPTPISAHPEAEGSYALDFLGQWQAEYGDAKWAMCCEFEDIA